MKTTQLKCPSCGSTDLNQLQRNEYQCAHCKSTLKLDSEGRRLELTGWVCPQCSFNNLVGQRFCGECGTNLVRACPRCKAENPLGMQFCGSCGFDYALQVEWEELQRELAPLQQELGKLTAKRDSLTRAGANRATQLGLKISELEKIGATPASLREWAKKREETRPQLVAKRQWFKRQSRLRKVAILASVPLLFLCLCAGLASLVSPTPEETPTMVATGLTEKPTTETQAPTSIPVLTADDAKGVVVYVTKPGDTLEGVLKVSDVVDYPTSRVDQRPFVGIYSHKIAVNARFVGPWPRFAAQLGLLKHALRGSGKEIREHRGSYRGVEQDLELLLYPVRAGLQAGYTCTIPIRRRDKVHNANACANPELGHRPMGEGLRGVRTYLVLYQRICRGSRNSRSRQLL